MYFCTFIHIIFCKVETISVHEYICFSTLMGNISWVDLSILFLNPFCFPVFWSCQFIARASNMSLRHWQQMGGVKINEDIVIDKSIHRSINSRSSVLKV